MRMERDKKKRGRDREIEIETESVENLINCINMIKTFALISNAGDEVFMQFQK